MDQRARVHPCSLLGYGNLATLTANHTLPCPSDDEDHVHGVAVYVDRKACLLPFWVGVHASCFKVQHHH
jgi:hypothetical protein